MNRLRFVLLTLALVLTFAARAPRANAACLLPCSLPDGSYVRGPASGCCSMVEGHVVHSFQRYAVWICTAGCAHPPAAGFACSTDICDPT